MADDRIGVTFVIPPGPHIGHTVTVEKKGVGDKPELYLLRCECGTPFFIGSAWIDHWLGVEVHPDAWRLRLR